MSIQLEHYRPGRSAAWGGRVDATAPREALRWHQVVESIDLRDDVDPAARRAGACFIGYACDEGVARNEGRRGAAGGPDAIRRALSNLPVDFSEAFSLFDAGDVGGEAGVAATQRALAAALKRARRLGLFPIVLGGGHDLEFGHWLGVRQSLPGAESVGIVSFDAHLDLRGHAEGPNSGTSFSQIAEAARREGQPFAYLCLGLQRSANTVAHFRRAAELGVEYELARDMREERLPAIEARIDAFVRRVDHVLVSVDMDSLSSAFAPGVSAPQPLGLHPETLLRLLKRVLESGRVISLDVAEVSPRFDDDGQTAKVAAIFLFAALARLVPPEARIA